MRRRDFIKALASSTATWPRVALAQHAIPGTTRVYVMNGLFVGTGLAAIAGRLRERGYIASPMAAIGKTGPLRPMRAPIPQTELLSSAIRSAPRRRQEWRLRRRPVAPAM